MASPEVGDESRGVGGGRAKVGALDKGVAS